MLLAFPAIVSAQHTGKVFVDANHNGRWDKGETLMKGISVSDGLNVVLTDEKDVFVRRGTRRSVLFLSRLLRGIRPRMRIITVLKRGRPAMTSDCCAMMR